MIKKQITAEPVRKARSHWFHLSPDRFVVGLLFGVCLLWLFDRFQWFGFNHHKGWTVLIAVAAVGMAALVMLLWWIAGLILGWRFQFGIRSVLAFCLASSIATSWLAVETKQARRQVGVVESITAVGGGVSYDWDSTADGMPNGSPGPPEPDWLRTMLGDDFFSTVFVIYGTHITDAGLEHVTDLKQLRRVDLTYTEITDAGLEHLKEMTQLRFLSLCGTKVTDAGLEHLKGLTQLQTLILYGTGVTAAGVEKLQQSLPNCEIAHDTVITL